MPGGALFTSTPRSGGTSAGHALTGTSPNPARPQPNPTRPARSLRSLPPELGLMTTLRSVPLDGNPLKLVRREIWAGGQGRFWVGAFGCVCVCLAGAFGLVSACWPGLPRGRGSPGGDAGPPLSTKAAAHSDGCKGPFRPGSRFSCPPRAVRRDNQRRLVNPLAPPPPCPCRPAPLAPAGPVSALLEHLRSRLPDPASQPLDGPRPPPAADAYRRPSGRLPSGGGGTAAAGSSAGGCSELLLHGRGLSDLPAEVADPAAAAGLTRLDLGQNPALGPAIAKRGGLPAMPRLRGLGLAGCGVAEWPLPRQPFSDSGAGGAALAALQSLDLRGGRLVGVGWGAPPAPRKTLWVCACSPSPRWSPEWERPQPSRRLVV